MVRDQGRDGCKTTADKGGLVTVSPVGDRMGCNQDKAIAKKKQSKEVGLHFHDERFCDELMLS